MEEKDLREQGAQVPSLNAAFPLMSSCSSGGAAGALIFSGLARSRWDLSSSTPPSTRLGHHHRAGCMRSDVWFAVFFFFFS